MMSRMSPIIFLLSVVIGRTLHGYYLYYNRPITINHTVKTGGDTLKFPPGKTQDLYNDSIRLEFSQTLQYRCSYDLELLPGTSPCQQEQLILEV